MSEAEREDQQPGDIALPTVYEEQQWNDIVHTPRVRRNLRRLAAEARRQFTVGETEEGGFGLSEKQTNERISQTF
jgi:hypothetical protein